MGRYRLGFCLSFAIFLILQPIATSAASSKVYVFSWDIQVDQIDIDYSNFRIGFHYDTVSGEGLLVSPGETFTGRTFELLWFSGFSTSLHSVYRSSIATYFPTIEDITGSIYQSNTETLFVIAETFNFGASGIISITRTGRDTYEVNENALRAESLPTRLVNFLGIGYHESADQILVIGEKDLLGLSFLYDFASSTWVQLETPSPAYSNRWGVLEVAAEEDQAVYFNSYEASQDGKNLTYIFDFSSGQWGAAVSHQIPYNLVGYEIIYHSEIGQYFLIGGRDVFTNELNSAIWVFDPDTFAWTEIYKEFPILTVAINPKGYYDSQEDVFVFFTDQQVYTGLEALIFSLYAEVNFEGYQVDLGMPIDTFLTGIYFTLGSGALIAATYVFLRRKSIFGTAG